MLHALRTQRPAIRNQSWSNDARIENDTLRRYANVCAIMHVDNQRNDLAKNSGQLQESLDLLPGHVEFAATDIRDFVGTCSLVRGLHCGGVSARCALASSFDSR
jgi:Mg-chelatase subunit ChlI